MADQADWARGLHESIRRRVLRRALLTDARIVRMFERLGTRLRRRFRLVGMTEAQVSAALREEFAQVEDELLPSVERDLRRAAGEGNEAARKTLERLGALEAADPFAPAPVSPSPKPPALRLVRGSGGSSPETD